MRFEKKSSLKSDKKPPAKTHKKGVASYNKKTALLEEAITHMNTGKYGRSSAALKELLALDPLNMEARRLFATLHLRLGSLISARTAFEALAREALQRQDFWLAESLLREYLTAGPRCVPFLDMLGQLYEEKGDAMAAVVEYGKAIDVLIEDPDSEHPGRAAELYAKIRSLAPGSPVAFRLSTLFDSDTGELLSPASPPAGPSVESGPPIPSGSENTTPPNEAAAPSLGLAVETSEPPSESDAVEASSSASAPSSCCFSTEAPASVQIHDSPQPEQTVASEEPNPSVAIEPIKDSTLNVLREDNKAADNNPLFRLADDVSVAATPVLAPETPRLHEFSLGTSEVSSPSEERAEAPITPCDSSMPAPDVILHAVTQPISQSVPVPGPMPWEHIQDTTISIPVPQEELLVSTEAAPLDAPEEKPVDEPTMNVTASVDDEPVRSAPSEASVSSMSWDDILAAFEPAMPDSPSGIDSSVTLSFPPVLPNNTEPDLASIVNNDLSPTQLDEGATKCTMNIPCMPGSELVAAPPALPIPMPWEQVEDEPVSIPSCEPEPEFGPAEDNTLTAFVSEPLPPDGGNDSESPVDPTILMPNARCLPTDPAIPEPEQNVTVPPSLEFLEPPVLSAQCAETAPDHVGAGEAEFISETQATNAVPPEQPTETNQDEEVSPTSPIPLVTMALESERSPIDLPEQLDAGDARDETYSVDTSAPAKDVAECLSAGTLQANPVESPPPVEDSRTHLGAHESAYEIATDSHQPAFGSQPFTLNEASSCVVPPDEAASVADMDNTPRLSDPAEPCDVSVLMEEPAQSTRPRETGSGILIRWLRRSQAPPPAGSSTAEEPLNSSSPVHPSTFLGDAHYTSTISAVSHIDEPGLAATAVGEQRAVRSTDEPEQWKPFSESLVKRVRLTTRLAIGACFSTTRSITISFLSLCVASMALVVIGIGIVGLLWLAVEERPNSAYLNLTAVPARTIEDASTNGYLFLLDFERGSRPDVSPTALPRQADLSSLSAMTACLAGTKIQDEANRPSGDTLLATWYKEGDPAARFRAQATSIRNWAEQEAQSVTRYKQWLRMPFDDWGYGEPISPNCGLIRRTHRLYIAEGFAQDLESGVERLEADLGTWRRVMSHAKSLPIKMLAADGLTEDVAVLSGLLSRTDLDEKFLGRLGKLARPLDQAEQSLRWPMQSELTMAGKVQATLLKPGISDSQPLYASVLALMPLPKQKRLNDYATYYEAAKRTASEGRWGSLPKRSHFLRYPPENWIDYGANPIENMLAVPPLPAWDFYEGRIRGLDAHLRLAGLQAWLRRSPHEQDLLSRMAKGGQGLYDPFTELPMLVNRSKGRLYSVGVDGKDNDGDPTLDITAQLPSMPGIGSDGKRSVAVAKSR